MKQEDKKLLLKILCAMLPYGVKVTWDGKYPLTVTPYIYCAIASENNVINLPKLLLRPISSMTEEEKEELKQISNDYLDEWENAKTPIDKWKLDAKVSYKRAVFYNSHHFDWNGLIEKNLALDCTGLHIYD